MNEMNRVLRYVCRNNNLDLAKRLFIIWPTFDIQYVFIETCSRGHMKVLKWLYKIKPDINISAENEKAFRNACYFNHIEVA